MEFGTPVFDIWAAESFFDCFMSNRDWKVDTHGQTLALPLPMTWDVCSHAHVSLNKAYIKVYAYNYIHLPTYE